MRQSWSNEELEEHWSLLFDERQLLRKKISNNRLIFAALLKFFQYMGRFPENPDEIPKVIIKHLAQQLKCNANDFGHYYYLHKRIIRKYKAAVRKFLNFRQKNAKDMHELEAWLIENVLPKESTFNLIETAVYEYLRKRRIEPPSRLYIKQYIDKAIASFESQLFSQIANRLSHETRHDIDILINTHAQPQKQPIRPRSYSLNKVSLNQLKRDSRQASIDTVFSEIAKLKRIQQLNISHGLFKDLSFKVLNKYRLRITLESPKQIRSHTANQRYFMVAAFCYLRGQTITDELTDILLRITHKINKKAEKRVIKELIQNVKKVHGKTNLLYRLAEVSIENPLGIISKVIYPVAGEQALRDLVKEFKSTGFSYYKKIHCSMRLSYSHHYRRMLTPLLHTLRFHTNNPLQHPVMKAIELLKKYATSKLIYFLLTENVPIEGVIRDSIYDIVVEKYEGGKVRINRINYEIAVLQTLREKLRCKEIWVEGAYRYRNPDEDLPADFNKKRAEYYQLLKQPLSANKFIVKIKNNLKESLTFLNEGMPKNTKVKIITRNKKGWISLTPLKAQPEPENIEKLKAEIAQQWPMISLLDILKEVDMQVDITSIFRSMATREILSKGALQKRLLLCLFALGTNTGLKRISSGNPGISYNDLRYVRKRFMQKDYLRQAIIKVANAIFAVRDPAVWGEVTVSCASDSKKFGAWDQNLMTEWHVRYGGRGIMIYWHVEKNSVCVYSQLKNCSSSEVAAMIEGILRHCTDMSIEKNYVDSHGQSEVAFAFSHILNFDLLPRLKDIGSQKLYRCEDTDEYAHLMPVLSRSIKWGLIKEQYDQIIQYAISLKLGAADSEAILRIFTRYNRQHPTYQAISELGKARKTIFLCHYLHREILRQETYEGLNTIERWNGVNGFIFYGKGGDIATNSREDQELSMLCLHLLQICLVYINTLMIQQILAKPEWLNRLTVEDKRALTPLIHIHVNPYGLFLLDMRTRLPLTKAKSYA